MSTCVSCGIPVDAGVFDRSAVRPAPARGEQLVLASYDLHRNYCGLLLHFAQFTDRHAADGSRIHTPGYVWEIRSDGQPLEPYQSLDHIINPWGHPGVALQLRLDGGARLELVIRNVDVDAGDERGLRTVGGRILGRYWYNPDFGARSNGA